VLELSDLRFSWPPVEVPLGPITPIIHVKNSGDEGAAVVGLVRIYRISTGLLVYDSNISPQTVEAGATAELEALTAWLPPAPADADYFVNGWLTATSTTCATIPWSGNVPSLTFAITAPPPGPYPDPHAPTHEVGGSDPVVVLDHGGLSGLADDDHPQYRLRHEVLYETDLLWPNNATLQAPYYQGAVGTGSYGSVAGEPNHPGIVRHRSSVGANSGYFIATQNNTFLLAGGETSRCWFKPITLGLTVRRCGFSNLTAAGTPSAGAFIWQDPATGIIYGKTYNVAGNSTTGTGFQLVINTWYLEKVVVNSDATQVDFYLYSEAGTELWHDSLAANIPTAVGDDLAHSVVDYNTGTTSLYLFYIDYLSILIPNRRPNL